MKAATGNGDPVSHPGPKTRCTPYPTNKGRKRDPATARGRPRAAMWRMAQAMSFVAAMGHPCAPDFVARDFLAAHPEYAWASGLLRDMKTEPWTSLAIGMK